MKKLFERIVFTLFISLVFFAAMVVFGLIESIAPIR
jgi:hypothetical protein